MSSTLYEAIIVAFEQLGGTKGIAEIRKHISSKHGKDTWEDFGRLWLIWSRRNIVI